MHDFFVSRRPLRGGGLLTSLLVVVAGCHSAPPSPTGAALNLASPAFANGVVPFQYSSCSGASNISPALSWKLAPAGTRSLVLIMYDKDSPLGANFVHWTVYDLPPTTTGLPEAVTSRGELPDGFRQGRNGRGDVGYTGPCPPGRTPHHYVFDLYALDTSLNLPPAAEESQLIQAMRGHVVAGGEFTAVFVR